MPACSMHAKWVAPWIAAALTASLLAGCGTMNSASVTMAEFNVAFEREGNKLLLLNIVRAMHRHPLYFTSISQMRGSTTFSAGLDTFEIPIGGGTAEPFVPSPVFGVSSNPTFDVGVLDSKEFVQGILRPISMAQVDYYWNQGWNRELLLLLLTERIERAEGNLDNYPSSSAEFARFRAEVRRLLRCSSANDACLGIRKQPSVVFDEIGLDAGAPSSLGLVMEAEKSGLALERVADGRVRVVRQRGEFAFTTRDGIVIPTPAQAPASASASASASAMVIHLRSPQGIIYYLGELARTQILGDDRGSRSVVSIRPCGPDGPEAALFHVARDIGASDAFITVGYDRHEYSITAVADDQLVDRCMAPRTMSVLSLVSQLLSLQRSASDQPTTEAVQVIGR